MRFILFLVLCFTLQFTLPGPGQSAQQENAAQEMTREAAARALADIEGEVISAEPTPVPGIYLIAMKMQGRIVPLYLDQSGSYLFSGNLISLENRENLTETQFQRLNPVDLDSIPLDDAFTLGNPDAAQQMVVFTDPNCPHCSKLHGVLKQAVKENPELAFHIKLIPLLNGSYEKTQTIVCNNSLEQLEMAFAGEHLPATDCASERVEENLALANQLGIRATPTLILPNGQRASGYRPLSELLELIKSNQSESAQ
jgi:thiol:disulfide interchange protein DsbC